MKYAACVALALLVTTGAALRLWQVHAVVVQGDEIHPLRNAVHRSLGSVATEFEASDKGMPIALLSWILLRTTGLDETGLRVLPLASGVGLLVVAAFVSRRVFGRPEDRVAFVALVVTSPLLVFWSRHARPYAIVTLLAATGMALAWRLARTRSRGTAAAFVAHQSLLHFTSLTALPFTAGLCLAGAVHELARRDRDVRGALLFLALGPATLASTAVLLAPALPSILAMLREKLPTGPVTSDTVVAASRMVLGFPASREPGAWIAPALVGVLALAGVVSVVRRRPALGAALVVLLVTPTAGHLLVHVRALEQPAAFARYHAALVPVYFALVVIGAAWLRDAVSLRWSLARPVFGVAVAAGIALLIVTGPLPGSYPPGAPFGLRGSTLLAPRPLAERAEASRIPAFYRERRGEPGLVIVEWPARPSPRQLYAIYQAWHGGRVQLVLPWEEPGSGFRFRTMIAGAERMLDRAREGAYVVLHRDPARERFHIHGSRAVPWPGEGSGRRPPHYDAVCARCREALGPPVFEDRWISVFGGPRP